MMAQSRLEANMINYSVAVTACAQGGEWMTASDMLSAMVHGSVERALSTYNASIRSNARGG